MTTEYHEPDENGEVEIDQAELIESPFKRAFTVIFSPRLTFESLAVKSSRMDWIVPIIFTIIVALLMINTGYDYIQSEQYSQTIDRIRQNSSLSDEQKDTQIEQVRESLDSLASIGQIYANISAVIGTFASIAVIALVLMGIARFLLGSTLTFSNGYKIAALSSMISAVGTILQIPLMLIFESFTRSQLSIGLLLPSGMSEGFLYQLININVFTVLYTVFLSIGLAVFTHKSLSKTLTPLAVLWLIFRVVVVGVTGMVSGIGV